VIDQPSTLTLTIGHELHENRLETCGY